MKKLAVIIIITLLFPLTIYSMPIVGSNYSVYDDSINLTGQSVQNYRYQLDLIRSNPIKGGSSSDVSTFLSIVKIDQATDDSITATSVKLTFYRNNSIVKNSDEISFAKEYDLTPFYRNKRSPSVSDTILIPDEVAREAGNWSCTIEVYGFQKKSNKDEKSLVSQPVSIDTSLLFGLTKVDSNEFIKEKFRLD